MGSSSGRTQAPPPAPYRPVPKETGEVPVFDEPPSHPLMARQPTGLQPLPNELPVSIEQGRGLGERQIRHHLLISIMGSRPASEKASTAMSASSSRNAPTSPTGDAGTSATLSRGRGRPRGARRSGSRRLRRLSLLPRPSSSRLRRPS